MKLVAVCVLVLWAGAATATPYRQLWQPPQDPTCPDPMGCYVADDFCGLGAEQAFPLVLAWWLLRRRRR